MLKGVVLFFDSQSSKGGDEKVPEKKEMTEEEAEEAKGEEHKGEEEEASFVFDGNEGGRQRKRRKLLGDYRNVWPVMR